MYDPVETLLQPVLILAAAILVVAVDIVQQSTEPVAQVKLGKQANHAGFRQSVGEGVQVECFRRRLGRGHLPVIALKWFYTTVMLAISVKMLFMG